MSSKDKDRKVSKPTEKDFIHGIASSYDNRGGAGLLLGLAISYLFGKAGRK